MVVIEHATCDSKQSALARQLPVAGLQLAKHQFLKLKFITPLLL